MTGDPLLRPLASAAAVTIDARERALVVRPAGDARAYVKLLWSEGHRAQVEAAASRYPGGAPTVWASGGGESKVAFGLPGDDGTMRFRFSRGDPVYKELVAMPGLAATIVVDRETSHIMSVRFHGRRT